MVHDMPLEVTLRIDLAMVKLVHEATNDMCFIDKKGRDTERIWESAKKKSDIKAVTKHLVIETYYRINTEGISFHKVATKIKEHLRKKHKSPPSIDTIKRYLREEGLI